MSGGGALDRTATTVAATPPAIKTTAATSRILRRRFVHRRSVGVGAFTTTSDA
jgi:hypothetical protein